MLIATLRARMDRILLDVDPIGSDPIGSDPIGSDPTGSDRSGSACFLAYRLAKARVGF